MTLTGNRVDTREAWKYVLICLAVAALTCAAKNFLSLLVADTFLCPLLCPSLFAGTAPWLPTPLSAWFELERSTGRLLQEFLLADVHDPYRLLPGLLFAPLAEEGLYRGPLYLLRERIRAVPWWAAAVLLAALFALSHQTRGLALLAPMVLGLAAAWLIARTGRFWPCIALHFLFNFLFISIRVYQSLFWAD